MRTEVFNFVNPKRETAKVLRKFSLPVIAATLEVFVCRPLNGLRLTRASCAKVSMNPPSLGPCASCLTGDSHKRGRVPGTWPDGQPILTYTIQVGGKTK